MTKQKVLQIKITDGDSRKVIKSASPKITVGRNIENTISLGSADLPESVTLFEKKGDFFYLLVTDNMKSCKVKVGGSTLLISDLIAHDLLPKVNENTYLYKIAPKCVGVVAFNNTKLTFAVSEAPVPPKPQKAKMPKEFKRRMLKQEDMGFIGILIMSLLIHGYMGYIFETAKLPKQDITDIKKIPKRFAKLILGVTAKQLKEIKKPKIEKKKEVKKEEPKKEEKKKEEPKKEEKKKEKPKKEEKKKEEVKKKEPPKEIKVVEKKKIPEKPKGPTAAQIRAKRIAKVKKTGLLAMLAGKRPGGSKRNSVSNFISNKDLSQNLNKVLTDMGGLQNVTPTVRKIETKEETAVDIDNVIAQASEEAKSNVTTIELKDRKKTNIEDLFAMEGSGATDPKRSKQVIAGVVRTYISALKYLYTRELRKDPTLEGKIVIQFTILANGKVTGCSVLTTTMNHRRFEKAMVKRIRTWKFEPIDEGEVTIKYPFIFFPTIAG